MYILNKSKIIGKISIIILGTNLGMSTNQLFAAEPVVVSKQIQTLQSQIEEIAYSNDVEFYLNYGINVTSDGTQKSDFANISGDLIKCREEFRTAVTEARETLERKDSSLFYAEYTNLLAAKQNIVVAISKVQHRPILAVKAQGLGQSMDSQDAASRGEQEYNKRRNSNSLYKANLEQWAQKQNEEFK